MAGGRQVTAALGEVFDYSVGQTTTGTGGNDMASTQEVFDHHVQGFVARDVSMILEDFEETSIVIANGETFKGLAAVQDFFTRLFGELPKDCSFELTECIVVDKSVYIVWNAESETVVYDFATDTFVIEEGKIVLQTVGFVKREKA